MLRTRDSHGASTVGPNSNWLSSDDPPEGDQGGVGGLEYRGGPC
jgi:hypothetical protein